jgi:SAM-dependent methyltransferase
MVMITDRGTNGRKQRIRSLDVESHQDFVRGLRAWTFGPLDAVAGATVAAKVADDTPVDDARPVIAEEPLVALRLRLWLTSQQLMWRSLEDHFGRHYETYADELAAAEAQGPASLELNELDLPEYARHEIHIQPGGYVGDKLGGYVYRYGTDTFLAGMNERDEVHGMIVGSVTAPADGKVENVLDLACTIGQTTTALKERFPDATVTGIDIAEPMLRYAHMRANELGVDVRFAQRFAEDNGFADGSMDLVVANILFHEVPADVQPQIIGEVFRVLRPGGVFDVTDFKLATELNPYRRFIRWADHVYNTERWSEDFVTSDFIGNLERAGFEVSVESFPGAPTAHYTAVKPSNS